MKIVSKVVIPPNMPPITTITNQPIVESDSFPIPDKETQQYIHSLFGKSKKETIHENIPLNELPKTKLNLTLTGTIVAGPESLALISVNGQAEIPIMIDQQITDEVTLQAVYPEWVTILNAGKYETIQIKAHSITTNLGSGNVVSIDTETSYKPEILKKPLPERELQRSWEDILKKRQNSISQ